MIQAGTLSISECRRRLQAEGRDLLEEISQLETNAYNGEVCKEDYEGWRIRAQGLILKFELLDHLEKTNQESE